MLTGNDEIVARPAPSRSAYQASLSDEVTPNRVTADVVHSRLGRVLRIEWLGQTVASLCWIGSALAYGISTGGDLLQLFAASSWLVANIAAAVTVEAK